MELKKERRTDSCVSAISEERLTEKERQKKWSSVMNFLLGNTILFGGSSKQRRKG